MKIKNLFSVTCLPVRQVCIIACCLLPAANSFSQTWLWAKSVPVLTSGILNIGNEGCSVSADIGGNVFITGYFSSPTLVFGTTILINAGGNQSDIFIAKYDANGNILWAKSAGGKSTDSGNFVSADASGNVFVTGYFGSSSISFGTTTLTKVGGGDVFIAKYDGATGNVIWAKSSAGAVGGNGISVSADVSGNVFVTGIFFSPSIAFDTITLTTSAYSDLFIAKYDANGNVLWAKRAGVTTGENFGNSVSTDVNGNVFLTGTFTSPIITFDSILLNNFDVSGTTMDIFIAKYDAGGNVLWAQRTGETSSDMANSVSTDAGGNVFVTGCFYSPSITFGTITLINNGFADLFIAKYDASGNVLWVESAGGAWLDEGGSVSADAVGNVYLTGGFRSPSITFGSTTLMPPLANCLGGCDPMFIVKYDGNGNVLCASALPSGGDDGGLSGVSADPYGNTFIGNDFEINPFIVGSDTLSFTGGPAGENIFVAKYTCCSNITSTINGTNTICQGSNATLIASGGLIYSWNTGATGSTIIVAPSTTTAYAVTVKDNNGCTGNATFSVTVLPAPTANASGNITIAQGQSATLTASGGGTYLWSSGLTDSLITVSPTTTTQYCITVTDASSCTDTACVIVTLESVDCSGELYLPNAFSPNADGENDMLKIYFGNINCIKTLELAIYDRWGEKVFSATGGPASGWETLAWDGLYKGKPESTAVFVYYLKATLTSGEEINRKENVSLLR